MHAWLRHSGALASAAFGLPVLAVGALLRPGWRGGLGERLGLRGCWDPGSLWVHAASVGECFAAARLFAALERRGHRILASATTPAGREVLAQLRGDGKARFAPLDHPWCVDAAMERADPRALILVETELWPIWIAAAARRGVPVFVVSARLSDRSLPRYRRLAAVLRSTWAQLSGIGARSERDAERFLSLGVDPARVQVTGDLKLDAPGEGGPLAAELSSFLATHRFWGAVSTHAGEERAVLDAFEAIRARDSDSRLLLAPRHLDRVAALERALAARRIPYHLRSHLGADAFVPGGVLVLDTLGEAPALLRRAQFVFVGGTLVPIGGHNVVEPASARRPVLFGPHTANVADSAERLLRAGAAERVADAEALRVAAIRAWGDPAECAQRGERGWRAVSEHRGAADRSAAWIEAGLSGASRSGVSSRDAGA